MPNRQKLRKQRKEQDLRQRSAAVRRPPPANAEAVSPLAQKIVRGGQRNIEEGLTQLMMESAPLRLEPEFRDLHFDSMRAVEVSGRVFPQYALHFKKAEHKSQDERQQIYDDFRIEVIDELTTPEFRLDLLQRLDRCAARFRQEGKQERWEVTTLLKTVLEQPNISWGICMLVITLFDEALKQAEQQNEEAVELLGDYAKLPGGNTDLSELLTVSAEPAQIEALGRKLGAKPGLRERLERQAQDVMDHFEEDIYQGKYDLQLFSEAELLRALQCYSDYLALHPIERNSTKGKDAAKPLAECMERTVREIATPKRLTQLVKGIEQTARVWLRQGKPEGALLHIEGRSLAADQSPENYLLYILFAGQMRRISKEARDKPTQS